MRLPYKSFGINMTGEKSQMPNLDTYLVLMPQVLVGAGCPQGPASTCCAFQPIIYPKVQQVHTLIFDASSNGIQLDLKQGTGVGQPLKTCIHSKHESTSNQPTDKNKKVFQRNTFILTIVSSCNGSSQPMWMIEASFKDRAADSNITPVKMLLEFIEGGEMSC